MKNYLPEIETAIFKTQIRINAIKRCFPKDSLLAEMESYLCWLTLLKEAQK
jgi:hypothetical protein